MISDTFLEDLSRYSPSELQDGAWGTPDRERDTFLKRLKKLSRKVSGNLGRSFKQINPFVNFPRLIPKSDAEEFVSGLPSPDDLGPGIHWIAGGYHINIPDPGESEWKVRLRGIVATYREVKKGVLKLMGTTAHR